MGTVFFTDARTGIICSGGFLGVPSAPSSESTGRSSERIAGEPPFTGPTPQTILARSLTEEVQPLATKRAGLPASLESTVRRDYHPQTGVPEKGADSVRGR